MIKALIKPSVQSEDSIQIAIYDGGQVRLQHLLRSVLWELQSIETSVALGVGVQLIDI